MTENLLSESCSFKDKGLPGDKAFMLRLLEDMMTVRRFEEKVRDFFAAGMLHGTAHLGVGEEAAAIGTTAALALGDYILVTHRGHGQVIGKGCGINEMMAELFGKAGGICGGLGGSMHMGDFDKGVLCANGIVGANAPLACGAALTIKKKKLDRVCVTFFGDGASNQGAVHESMNLAAVWNLPLVFCLVNNGYAMSTPLKNAVRETDLAKRAAGYGIKALECDGNDVLQVYETAKEARTHALKHGPVLLVEHTYRISGHSKGDTNNYRTDEEIDKWKKRDPITRFSGFLIENGIFTTEEIKAADKKTADAVEKSVEYAMSLPEPDKADILKNIYA